MITKPQLSAFQFTDYRLLKLLFQVNETSASGLEEVLPYQLKFVSSIMGEVVADRRELTVQLEVSVEWPQPENAPFVLNVLCQGRFSCAPEMPREQFKGLCEVHAPALLYTQLRPLVRLVSSEAEEAFTLPLINLSETMKRQQNAEGPAVQSEPAAKKAHEPEKKRVASVARTRVRKSR